jgi:peptidoglycan/xylan/chitin deacetylase (PgdA/CDA1 family)
MNPERHERVVYPRTIKVLQYHRVLPDEMRRSMAQIGLSEKKFREQLRILDHLGFTTITFDDYRLCLEGELSLPRKPIVITFDDGYLDTYELAFPILQEFGMRAVIFVLGDRNIRTNLWEAGRDVPVAGLMNDQQILELHQAGFEIGSHGLTHADLTQFSGERAWEEVSRSRVLIEIVLNAPICTFAYPYGFVNETLKGIVADAGYTFACSGSIKARSFTGDPLEIRRLKVPETSGQMGFMFQALSFHLASKWMQWKT